MDTQEKEQNDLKEKLRPGMIVEVLNQDNRLIFMGKVLEFDGTDVRIAERTGQEVPPVFYNTEVKLRSFLSEGGALVLWSTVCGSTDRFWKLTKLRSLVAQEKRMFFRQAVSVEAEAVCVNGLYEPQTEQTEQSEEKEEPVEKCRILDISGGGLRLKCQREFQVGDWLFVNGVRIVEEEKPFSFVFRVLRVEKEERGYSLYGGQFEQLKDKEQDRLLSAIFALQRKELRSRRK